MTHHCSNSPGSKMGYRGYVFDPTDWTYSAYPNRLSTCEGKYSTTYYGSMTLGQILGIFERFCPYEVLWNVNHDTRSFSTVSNSRVPREWMTENIKGYYRDLSFNEATNNSTTLGIWRAGVKFQLKDDALLFKLTWVGE